MQSFAQSVAQNNNLYTKLTPHSLQNFAIAEFFAPHSEQNCSSPDDSAFALPYIDEPKTAPVGTYFSSSIISTGA